MPKPLAIDLSAAQRQELEHVRDHHGRAYMRERAAAILKIANGLSGRQVALYGLLKPRAEDTVYGWFQRYQAEGVGSLLIRPGRGRKPAFSPSGSRRGHSTREDPAGAQARSSATGTQAGALDAAGAATELSLATSGHARRHIAVAQALGHQLQARARADTQSRPGLWRQSRPSGQVSAESLVRSRTVLFGLSR